MKTMTPTAYSSWKEELAEKGDVTAREALEDIVEPNIMFNVCYQVVESIAEAIYRLL